MTEMPDLTSKKTASLNPGPPEAATLADFASSSAGEVLSQLGSTAGGLTGVEAARRLASTGPNAVRTHKPESTG